jgi:hypothetical protein
MMANKAITLDLGNSPVGTNHLRIFISMLAMQIPMTSTSALMSKRIYDACKELVVEDGDRKSLGSLWVMSTAWENGDFLTSDNSGNVTGQIVNVGPING